MLTHSDVLALCALLLNCLVCCSLGAEFSGHVALKQAAECMPTDYVVDVLVYYHVTNKPMSCLQALMPVAVFIVGCVLGTESYDQNTMANMLVVSVGVAIASYGEINFVVIGVMLQMISICTESTRLTLVQILLQSRGLKLNPVTTLYYIAPCSAGFLLVPFALLEAKVLFNDPQVNYDVFTFLSNAAAAFALNMAVFLLIGKTSALTMNIAGVVKDWLLIGLSVFLFHSAVTSINLGGYMVAFLGVCWYNYRKLQNMKKKQAEKEAAKNALDDDDITKPLKNGQNGLNKA